MISVEDVSKTYAGQTALAPTTLTLAPGQTTVLIGPSGCGKSTLLRLMVGLITPATGRVVIGDTPLTAQNAESRRHEIGYVIQDGGLFPHLTAAQNVELLARHLGNNLQEIDLRVSELAQLVQLPSESLSRYPTNLSGGQRQRVGLMRALMLDPPLLLLDEPLGALDPITRSELQTQLKDIFARLQKTVVLVTHDMGEAAYFGDTIVLMREGKIVQSGTLNDLLHRPAERYVTDFIRAPALPAPGSPGGQRLKKIIRPLSLLLLLLLTGCGTRQAETLNVGSKRFAESRILGEMITQTADKAGEAQAVHQSGLGNTGIVFAALQSGSIDIYPEYTGTISQELLKSKDKLSLPEMNDKLTPLGLAVGVPLGFNDTYALAMRGDQADKLGIKTLSDLAKHPELKFGLSQEFLKRADGWPGVKAAYGLPFASPQGLDHGLAYEAIAGGQIDVTDIYSTDSKIAKYKLRVLEDDKHYFPAYDAVLLYRKDLPARLPRTWAALTALQGRITAAQMIALNAQVELQNEAPAAVAKAALSGGTATVTRETLWSALTAPDFWPETRQHLFLVFASLGLSILAGIPLGIWAARTRAAAQPVLSITGLIQTIPSLALLAFLIALLHRIGPVPTIAALFLYSLLPIVRNTYTGLTDISPTLRESALALGLPSGARLRLIELPLASRAIFAGIKTAAVINVGTATIAAFVGAGGYGDRITQGLENNDNLLLLAGAIPAAVLALLVQYGFDLLDRAVVPKGLRHSAPP